MKNLISMLFLSLALCGCGLIPKKVELFQDKVRKFPEVKSAEKETQRQTAALAALRAEETFVAAVSSEATNVVAPAKDTMLLTDSVSRSLGPPLKPASLPAAEQATKLDTAVAKLNQRLDEFKSNNNENAGKKIEGTGVFQVPYFVWLGGALVLGFFGLVLLTVVWGAVKMFAAANPPLALGVNAAQLAGKTVTKGLTQVLRGGENFKEAISQRFGNSDVAGQVLELFQQKQTQSQDEDVQTAIKHLTR
jgi:hypothetical protein